MLELFLSASLTLLPDYLYRRYGQGKRIGHEITLYSFWYELRWGITGCVALAITLITVIFYFHPTTNQVASLFRTVSVISDRPGRVEEVYVANNEAVRAGQPLFRLDTSRQRAAAETAKRRLAEIDAALATTRSELAVASANIAVAQASLGEARDDLARRSEVAARNPASVSEQELDRLRATVAGREGTLAAAQAYRDVTISRIDNLLPAERFTAEAQLAQAETEIQQATVVAGIDGVMKQFALKPGDIVNPILRPAGILVPDGPRRGRFVASFGQISAPVVHVGMVTEITCPSLALTVIPMVVTEVQDVFASGQFRPTDQLADLQQQRAPGTLLVFLEPTYPDSPAFQIPPGSVCVGVAYTDHSAAIEAGEITGFQAVLLQAVDSMGIANALVIRAQALLMPIWAILLPG